MTAPTRPVLRALAVLAMLLGPLALAAPAAAAEQVVTITAEGVSPKVLQVAEGDTVRFVSEDPSFAYRARSTSENWSFDSGPLGLLDGDYVASNPDGSPIRINAPGTYTYEVAEDEPFLGSVVLAAPAAAKPSPSGGAAAPKPSPAASPRNAGAAPAPGPTAGGTGTAAVPPLLGGLSGLPGVASPAPGGVALPPALAPALPGATAGPVPSTAPVPTPAPVTALAVPGDLAGAPSPRGIGLPAALAAVLAAGTASLLVRLLLAEPAARRARTGFSAAAPVATVD